MYSIIYTLTLHQPVLATALQGDPNSSVSLSYIPGSLLRGALIQQYINTNGKLSDIYAQPDAQQLFFNGVTRYLHAYPLMQGQRSLPVPRSLLRRKLADLSAKEGIQGLDASHLRCTVAEREQFEQARGKPDILKSLGTYYCVYDAERLLVCHPDRTVDIHIKRSPRFGRALRNDGEVFRYQALAAKQQFKAVILTEHEADAQRIASMFAHKNLYWLGRSRSAQYGKVEVSDVAVVAQWREYQPWGTPPVQSSGPYTYSLTLLSDTFLRDSQGAPVATLDAPTLASYLGLPQGQQVQEIVSAHSFSGTTRGGGFNRTWQLPLTQEYGLAAGSVITFTTNASLAQQQITQLEQAGIGARRIEGFGRVAINWHAQWHLTLQQVPTTKAEAGARITLAPIAQTLANRMGQRLYDQRLDAAITTYLQQQTFPKLPSKSQLGRLRVLVRRALPRNDLSYVRQQFGLFRPTARQQFATARIGTKPLDIWVEDLLNNPQRASEYVQLGGMQPHHLAQASHSPAVLVAQAATPNDEHVALRLLAAVLGAMARQVETE